MTEQEIKNLKKGDIIIWQNNEKGWLAYGRIANDGSLYCDLIIGDGDSNIGKDDVFYESEPFAGQDEIEILPTSAWIHCVIYERFKKEEAIYKHWEEEALQHQALNGTDA